MPEVTLFCGPGEVYRGLPESEVVQRYMLMAEREFDRLIRFDDQYAREHVDTPDFQETLGLKGGKPLVFTVFAEQPVVYVGGEPVRITSSSNLFTPRYKKGVWLPDLEVIQVASENARDVDVMLLELENLYAGKNNWKTFRWRSRLKRKKVPGSGRIEALEVIDSEETRRIAKDVVDYDPEKLCF